MEDQMILNNIMKNEIHILSPLCISSTVPLNNLWKHVIYKLCKSILYLSVDCWTITMPN